MATNSKSLVFKWYLLFSIEHLGLMSNFIVLVEVLIGYFKKIILANYGVL